MIVLTLINAQERTKGNVSRYLIEISPSVYIGHLDARTRDKLWNYVVESMPFKGYATLVYTSNCSQGYKIFTHNKVENKEVEEIDGIQLITKKPQHNEEDNHSKKSGWSKYSYYNRFKK